MFAFLGATVISCSPTYVLRAAWEEARILSQRRSMNDLLNDPNLDPHTRSKLELVVRARSFAAFELGLNAGDSFTSYADIGRDTLAFVLSASPPDRLAAHTWWFPIVGWVPYKGFFSRDAAERERRELERKNYDTYLRTTSAFSTLGWLPDPLLSTALVGDSVSLVETVIHEVTHNTLFVRGHVKFNESFANFIGSVGAIEFFCDRVGEARLCGVARDRWHDTRLFSEFLDELWDSLEALYAEPLDLQETLARREDLLARTARRYRWDLAPRMRTDGYARFDPGTLNNASLVARHLYYHRLPLFQALYERHGGLAETFAAVAESVSAADDPWHAVGALLTEAALSS